MDRRTALVRADQVALAFDGVERHLSDLDAEVGDDEAALRIVGDKVAHRLERLRNHPLAIRHNRLVWGGPGS